MGQGSHYWGSLKIPLTRCLARFLSSTVSPSQLGRKNNLDLWIWDGNKLFTMVGSAACNTWRSWVMGWWDRSVNRHVNSVNCHATTAIILNLPCYQFDCLNRLNHIIRKLRYQIHYSMFCKVSVWLLFGENYMIRLDWCFPSIQPFEAQYETVEKIIYCITFVGFFQVFR